MRSPEGKAVPVRLLVNHLALPSGHLTPVLLRDIGVILPAQSLLLLLFMPPQGGSLLPAQFLLVDHLPHRAGQQLAVNSAYLHRTPQVSGFYRRQAQKRPFSSNIAGFGISVGTSYLLASLTPSPVQAPAVLPPALISKLPRRNHGLASFSPCATVSKRVPVKTINKFIIHLILLPFHG